VDGDAVEFVKRYETDSIELRKCSACIHEWTEKGRGQSNRRKGCGGPKYSASRHRRLVTGGLPWHW
jgi:hypothetical protein